MQSIVRKAVRPFMVVLKGIILVLIICATGGAWAATDKTNPVTGATESYVNTFLGTNSSEWNAAGNWDTANVPYIQNGVYTSALIDGKTASTASASIDGWALQVGAYNDATVTWNSLGKIQTNSGTMWMTVDDTSSITINGWGGGNLGQNGYALNYYVAANNGVTWSVNLASGTDQGLTMNYYLAGDGSVSYKTLERCAHVIKMADITLTGTSGVSSKTLVSFTSTTKTFTAAADIKVYDGSTLKETVAVTSVRSSGAAIQNTTSALTTADAVGTCELVQCTDGIVLYYVDGDPSAVVAKTYKPSININFTSGTALSTAADVGYGDYAVPGTSWDNLVGNNGTLSAVHKIDSTAAQSTVSGASVEISGTRGYYYCSSLAATSDLRAGYIDENDSNTTPTVTVSGIPYDQYKVIVYTATDAANTAFGYITVNGTNYTYSEGALAEGTTSWGSSGAADSANAIAEGVNMLVTPTISGGTLTVVGHKMSGARGCIAAIQIVKVEQELEEGDLLIELEGDETYSFDSAGQYNTVYVTGEGTVTFAGTASTATTLHIGPSAAVNMNGSSLTPTTVTGNGTAVYDGAKPTTGLGWTDSANWTGTVWVKNIASSSNERKDWDFGIYGNANSVLRFSGVNLYFKSGDTTYNTTVDLEGDGLTICDAYGNATVISSLTGSGTFACTKESAYGTGIAIADATGFTGTVNFEKQYLTFGSTATKGTGGKIIIAAGNTATVASSETWTAAGGFTVDGTLNVNGTLASSATTCITGSGTVVSSGKLPSVNGSAWWQNTDWTGTVWIKSYAISALNSNLYGNEGSTLKFTGVTGYFAQNHANVVPIELENSGSTVAFNYNNGCGGELLTFSELKGTGTLQTSSAGNGGTIWVKKWDTFTGVMNLGHKQVVMGGDAPDHSNVNRNGKLVIAEGAVVTNLNATTSWTAGGGIEVNGTFAASDRTAWADGTAMTVNSTGVLNMYGSGINDTGKSFANVTGTGTIWYSQTTTANDKWSALPSSAANMFANTLSVSNDNVNAGVIITMNGASDVVTTNANISGTGYFRSDWGTGANRGFLALQSKNTTWSGTFGSSSRIKKFIVAGVDGATDRTLTLAGTQSSTIPLTVESLGSVNITGTYLGATTVSGTFGGTGTLTGNLTFNAGATFKAFASDSDGLAVSGTVTCPAESTVTVDVSALEQTGTKVLMTASGLDVSKFALASGQSGTLSVADGALKVSFVSYVAEYNGVQYETVQAAIDAAVADSHTYEDVTILDPAATCPDGYYVDTEDSDALKMYQAAIVKKNDAGKDYFKTGQLAFDAIATGSTYYGVYDYVEIYYGTGVEVSVNPAAIVWTYGSDPVRIKCYGEATVTVSLASTESTLTAGTADENGIVTYTKADVATTYVWAGGTTLKPWSNANNWKVGTLEGATATRKPGALDTVQIGDGAKVTDIVGSLSVAALQVYGTVTFTGGGSLTSASAITLGANDSITITGTLSHELTTNVSHSRVKAVTVGSTTTYSVEEIPGTIFSVY